MRAHAGGRGRDIMQQRCALTKQLWGLIALLAAPAAHASVAHLELDVCGTDSLATENAAARCGYIDVPENPDDVSGRHIRLRVTVIPALNLKPASDALLILAGGPGQGAHDFYASAGPAFAGIRRDRDIVLVDQRGTGRSHPLDCTADPADLEAADPQQMQTLARRCIASLDADPRFYTTSIAVRDLDTVRETLGYQQVSLYGVSYGTRVAQHYLRRYPSRVRTVILDGVVPVDLALGPDVAPRAQQALDAMFDRCADDKACDAAFPRLREQFSALHTRLGQMPIRARLPDPVTARMQDAAFGVQQLNAAVRLLTYSDETVSLLPLLIHEAQSASEPEPFIAQYLMVKRLTDTQFAYGMHFAVVCSEDAPRWVQQDVPDAVLERTYLGTSFMQGMRSVCEIWPRGVVDADFSSPLHSAAPVLILSGSNDPVTPPAYGERALRSFPNGRHLVLAGQGHGQLAVGCMPRLLAQFVKSASAATLDTKCLDDVAPTPFMLSRTAPAP